MRARFATAVHQSTWQFNEEFAVRQSSLHSSLVVTHDSDSLPAALHDMATV